MSAQHAGRSRPAAVGAGTDAETADGDERAPERAEETRELGDGGVVGASGAGDLGGSDDREDAGPDLGAEAGEAGPGDEASPPVESDEASEVWSRSSDTDPDAGEQLDDSPGTWPDTQIQMRFVEVAMVLPSTNPVVVLQEVDPPRRQLRIPVGTPEGVAIAYAARRIPTPKPLTHELFTDALESFALTLDVVRIVAVNGSAYSAELVLSGPAGSRVIACRPSDGIALALRQRLPAPITAGADVLDQAGAGAVDG